eukprot:PhF_6_TR36071/c0_g1_i6/m.52383
MGNSNRKPPPPLPPPPPPLVKWTPLQCRCESGPLLVPVRDTQHFRLPMDVLTVIVDFVGIDVAMSLRCVSTSYRHIVQEHPTHRYIPITLCEHSLQPQQDNSVELCESTLITTFFTLFDNVYDSANMAYNCGGIGSDVIQLSRDVSYLIELSLLRGGKGKFEHHPVLRDVLVLSPYDTLCTTQDTLKDHCEKVVFSGWDGTDPT